MEDQLSLDSIGINLSSFFSWPLFFSDRTPFWLALIVAVLRLFRYFKTYIALSRYTELDNAEQVRTFAYELEHNPVWANMIEILAYGKDGGDEDEFSQSPYSYTLRRIFVRDIFAGIRWGLLCYLFFIGGFTIMTITYMGGINLAGFINEP
ncbi:MAG: hypothetical protein WDO19_30540 [Bacteroidota bacterium]